MHVVEKAFVISLPFREDRLDSFQKQFSGISCLPEIEVWPAIHGDVCCAPENWNAGNGAWGCILPDNYVNARVKSAFKGKYTGDAVEIVTRGGDRLTVTVNHPILTREGFIHAGEVKEGAYVLRYQGHADAASSVNNVDNAATTIENVFNTLSSEGPSSLSKRVASLDFYGDGRFLEGNIEVVDADPFLLNKTKVFPQFGELREQERFIGAHSHLLGSFSHFGASLPGLLTVPLPGFERSQISSALLSHGDVSQVYSLACKDAPQSASFGPLLSRRVGGNSRADAVAFGKQVNRHSTPVLHGNLRSNFRRDCPAVRFGGGASIDSTFAEKPFEHRDRESAFFAELQKRFPGLVSLDEVVKVRRFFYSSHVYDLATDVGYFACSSQSKDSGVIVSNCYRSHMNILEYCLNNRIGSYIVFEDDCHIRKDVDVEEYMASAFGELPDDWQQLYLGGQLLHTHSHAPIKLTPHLHRPFNVNRTHCFAVSRAGMLPIYQHISCLPFVGYDHIDHHLGRWHEDSSNKVYCTSRWLTGQHGSSSNVSGKSEPVEFYPDPDQLSVSHWLYDRPVCVLFRGAGPLVRASQKFLHFGNTINAMGYDVTLQDAVRFRDPGPSLSRWYGWIRGEIAREGSERLPAVFHPEITAEMLEKYLGVEVLTVEHCCDSAAVAAEVKRQFPEWRYAI